MIMVMSPLLEPDSVCSRLNRARQEYCAALKEAADFGDTRAVLELSALESWIREAAQASEDVAKLLWAELDEGEEDWLE